MASISARACVSAAANASARSAPSGKKRWDRLTQPSLSDSSRSGVSPRPMMNSVEPAADVDHQARRRRWRQHVRDAQVDEPRLLVPGNDVDRKAERRLRLRQERRGVRRDPERVGRDRPDGGRMQSRQALAKAREAGQRGTARRQASGAPCRPCRRRNGWFRATCRGGRSGRLPRARSRAGSCSNPDPRPRASRAMRNGSSVGETARGMGRRGGCGRRTKPSRIGAARAALVDAPPAPPDSSRCAFLLGSPGCVPAASIVSTHHADRLPAEDPDRQGLRRRHRVGARPGADAVASPLQSRAAEARGPAAGVFVQVARRLQQDGASDAGRARDGASSRLPPAITRRAWRLRRRSSAAARPS